MERTPSSHLLDDPAAISTEARIRKAIDGYPATLVPLIAASYGPQSIQQAWREFMPGNSAPFTGDDAHGELFFSWLFHCWSPGKMGRKTADPSLKGVPPTQAFLERHSSDLTPLLRRYLQACLRTPFGFYQITECRPGTGFRARDLLAEAQLEVLDKVASSSLRKKEIIFARIPLVDEVCVIDAIAPVSFPPSFQGYFIQHKLDSTSHERSDGALRKSYFELLEILVRARLPEIRTTSVTAIEEPATYLCGGACAYPAEVIFGPEQEKG